MCHPISTFQLAQPVCGINPSLHTKSLKKIHVSFLKEVEGAVSDSGGRYEIFESHSQEVKYFGPPTKPTRVLTN